MGVQVGMATTAASWHVQLLPVELLRKQIELLEKSQEYRCCPHPAPECEDGDD